MAKVEDDTFSFTVQDSEILAISPVADEVIRVSAPYADFLYPEEKLMLLRLVEDLKARIILKRMNENG